MVEGNTQEPPSQKKEEKQLQDLNILNILESYIKDKPEYVNELQDQGEFNIEVFQQQFQELWEEKRDFLIVDNFKPVEFLEKTREEAKLFDSELE